MSGITRVAEFFSDESGLTVVEYVVGAGLIAIAFTGLFVAFSDVLTAEFSDIF